MGDQGRIEVLEGIGDPVVALIGAFDASNVDRVRTCLAGLRDAEHVIVDFASTTFIDSTIIGAIVRAEREGLTVRLRGATDPVLRALQAAGLAWWLEDE